MLGIDTNVVFRLIVSDDAEQTRRARKLVEQALSHDEPVLVSLLVLLESEWVLRSGMPRDGAHELPLIRCHSQAPRRSPAERRVESGERSIDAPLTVMDRLVLYKLPREQSKAERGAAPIDRRVDVDGLQCGEQVSLLVVKCGEERLPSQRDYIV